MENDNYDPPFWAINGMVETIVPALFRPVPQVNFHVELFTFPDADVIPLNWLVNKNKNLAVIVPGLESNSTRSYIKNISYHLHQAGFDVLVIDHRGCRIPNKVFRSYHSGNTEDLRYVIGSIDRKKYERLYLVGFSLGGNIVLKYLGENDGAELVYKAAAICAPLDLLQCSKVLESKKNRVFRYRFVRSLKKSLLNKQSAHPDKISINKIKACKTLWDVDELYTAPVHGFKSAEEYYIKCSSKNFIKNITIPTLVVNAKNDPLIPLDENTLVDIPHSNFLVPLITRRGGHMGFPTKWLTGINFYEKAVIDFFRKREMNW